MGRGEPLEDLRQTWPIEPQAEIRPRPKVSDALREARSWSMLVMA